MKCDEQTRQQKQIGLEASDLHERLLDSHYGLCWMMLLIDNCIDASIACNCFIIIQPGCQAVFYPVLYYKICSYTKFCVLLHLALIGQGFQRHGDLLNG